MNNRIALISAVFSLLVASQFVAADSVSVTISPYSAEGYTGAATSYVATVKNDRGMNDSFQLTVSGPHFSEWGSMDSTFMTLAAGSSATATITLTAPIGTPQGIFGYKVTATSFANSSVKSSSDILYTVLQKYPLAISKFSADAPAVKPGQAVALTATVRNMINAALSGYNMDMTIADAAGNVVSGATNVPVNLAANETKSVARTFPLDRFIKPGDYKATAVLRAPDSSEVSRSTTTFAVLATVDVATSRSETPGTIDKAVRITVTNNGNSEASNYVVHEQISDLWSWVVSGMSPAASKSSVAGYTTYQWSVASLKPGESFTISYKVAYWPYMIVAVVVVLIVAVAITEMQRPKIVKKVLRRGPAAIGKEFTIALEIRNPSRRTLHSVVLKDMVLPVFAVVRQFESLKPLMKKTDAGTELAWKLGDMKPHEERVITYKLSSVIGVSGVVRLSRAYMRYKDAKGRPAAKYSNAVDIGEKPAKEK